MQWLLALLIRYLYPALAAGIIRFLQNLKDARADDPTLLETLNQIVIGINRDHADWPWQAKRDYAFSAACRAASELGKDLTISLQNTLLELLHMGTAEPIWPRADVRR